MRPAELLLILAALAVNSPAQAREGGDMETCEFDTW
jgi:hypothetical protein